MIQTHNKYIGYISKGEAQDHNLLEGYYFYTECEEEIGPYLTREQAEQALNAYVSILNKEEINVV